MRASQGVDGGIDKPPRIQLWPLTLRLLLSLIVPVSLALLLDWALGTMPWLTMATALVCLPLASLIVGKASLDDFERIVAQVAPYEVPGPAAQAVADSPDNPDSPDDADEAPGG